MSSTLRKFPAASAPAASALRTRSEELENAVTHGFGAMLAVIGGVHLVFEATATADLWCVLGCLLYSVALVGVLTSSTLSHLYLPEHLNRQFRAFDQGFIYLLAVGSLSPFALTFLRTPTWLAYYGMCLTIAIAGFLSKVKFAHRVEKISLPLYLIQGWSQGFALIPLGKILPVEGMCWVMAGGACYCIGVVFLVIDNRLFKFHAIWHLWVIGACVCHYYAILKFVVYRA